MVLEVPQWRSVAQIHSLLDTLTLICAAEACKYKHALPPGFILKPKGKKEKQEEDPNAISIEEFLEVERHKLPAKLTPVTAESFAEWKKNRTEKKAAEAEALKKSKETQAQAGKAGGMSGRDLFEFSTWRMQMIPVVLQALIFAT